MIGVAPSPPGLAGHGLLHLSWSPSSKGRGGMLSLPPSVQPEEYSKEEQAGVRTRQENNQKKQMLARGLWQASPKFQGPCKGLIS